MVRRFRSDGSRPNGGRACGAAAGGRGHNVSRGPRGADEHRQARTCFQGRPDSLLFRERSAAGCEGPGAAPENRADGTGYGLSAMRQRVRTMGGDIDIESSPDGTAISASVLTSPDPNA